MKKIHLILLLALFCFKYSSGQWAELGGTGNTIVQSNIKNWDGIYDIKKQSNNNITLLEYSTDSNNIRSYGKIIRFNGDTPTTLLSNFLIGTSSFDVSPSGKIALIIRDSVEICNNCGVYDFINIVKYYQNGVWQNLHRSVGIDSMWIEQVHFTKNGNLFAVAKKYNTNTLIINYSKPYVFRWDGINWIPYYSLNQSMYFHSNEKFLNLTSDTSNNLYVYGKQILSNTHTLVVSRWNGTDWLPITGAGSSSFAQIDSSYTRGLQNSLQISHLTYKRVLKLLAISPSELYVSTSVQNSDSLYVISKWDGNSWNVLPRISNFSNMRHGSFQKGPSGAFYVSDGILDSLDRPYIAKFQNGVWSKLLGYDTIIPKYYNNGYYNMLVNYSLTIDNNENLYWLNNLKNESGHYFVSKYNPSNVKPVFSNGNSEKIFARINSGQVSLSLQLEVSDTNSNQIEKYKLMVNAKHGIVTIGGNVASGLFVSPAGWFYTPDLNYTGFDTLVIRVDDGEGGKELKTIVVHVTNPVAGTVSSNQVICINSQPNSITLLGSVGNIQWQSSVNGFAFANIVGATSTVLNGATIGNLATRRYYRAVVSIGIMLVNTAVVTVDISNCTSDLLYDVVLSKGVIYPYFDSYDSSYQISVSNVDSIISLTIYENDILANSEISVNNGAYSAIEHNVIKSGLNLNVGTNELKIKVRSANNLNTRFYYLYINRAGTPPVIDSINSYFGFNSDTLFIYGKGFNNTAVNNKIYFGAVEGNVLNSSTTQISVMVPIGASLEEISVLNISSGLAAYSNLLFHPKFSPTKDTISTTDFDISQNFIVPNGANKVTIGDFNNDGKPDMAISNGNSGISVYKQNGTLGIISFAARQDYSAGSWFSGNADFIKSVDLDGDGKLDLVFSMPNNNSISVIRNISSGGLIDFASVQHFSMGWNGLSKMCIADIDLDGREDVVFSTNSGGISILKNSSFPGNISFDAKQDFATNKISFGLSIGDLDGDKKPDLAYIYANDTLMIVRKNTSTGSTITFGAEVPFVCGLNPQDLILGDLDGDGKSDLVGILDNNSVFSFLNTSNIDSISFNNKQLSSASAQNKKLILAELNGDGLPEIIYLKGSNWTNNLSILSNKSSIGSIQFSTETPLTNSNNSTFYGFESNDIDGDGKMDIVASLWNGAGYVASVYRNILQTSNVYLNNLTIQTGSLNPGFDSTRLNYFVNVGAGVANFGLTASFSNINSTAQIKINGGSYSALTHQTLFNALPLNTGLNSIEIKITGVDGISRQSYNIIVLKDSALPSAYLDITAFFQGLYVGSGTMTSAPNNFDMTLPGSSADTIIVELHSSTNLFDSLFAWKGSIGTSGIANAELPGTFVGDSFYVVLKHRNSIETWSANPVTISAFCSYNFTISNDKAYGNNLVDLGSGVYGIYSGDINQDGSIDFLDYPDLDLGSINGDLGYLVTDLNGDASVDFLDYPMIDQNSLNGIILMRP